MTSLFCLIMVSVEEIEWIFISFIDHVRTHTKSFFQILGLRDDWYQFILTFQWCGNLQWMNREVESWTKHQLLLCWSRWLEDHHCVLIPHLMETGGSQGHRYGPLVFFLPLLPIIFGRGSSSFGNYLIAIFHMWEFKMIHKIGYIESHSLILCSALIFSTCYIHLLDLVNWSKDHLHLALEILPYPGHLDYKKFLKIMNKIGK